MCAPKFVTIIAHCASRRRRARITVMSAFRGSVLSSRTNHPTLNEATVLRRELGRLKRQVRENERIWSGFRSVEIQAIGAGSLKQLVHNVVRGIEQNFERVDCVSIASIDLDYEVQHLLEGHDGRSIAPWFVVLPEVDLQKLFVGPPGPVLALSTPKLQDALFPDYAHKIGSLALSPLLAAGRLIGCLAQGSRDPRHFSSGSSTELLQHLSATVALCLQNVVNTARLERYGLTDPLTGVANRRLLEHRMKEEVDRCRRYAHDLACMMIDIDHFKRVNDRYGHAVGDRVLREVASVLSKDLRASDILSRFGGEEFVLLLPETDIRKGVVIAERQRNDIADLEFDVDEPTPLTITASIGVTSLQMSGHEPGPERWLLEHADRALYQAKHAGRNRVVAYAR